MRDPGSALKGPSVAMPERPKLEARRAENDDGVLGRMQRAPFHQLGACGSAVSSPPPGGLRPNRQVLMLIVFSDDDVSCYGKLLTGTPCQNLGAKSAHSFSASSITKL